MSNSQLTFLINTSIMRKFLIGLAALIMTTGAFAQGFGQFNPDDIAKMQADRIKEVCKVDDGQYKKIVDYFVKDVKEMTAQMSQGQGGGFGGFDMEAMQKRMKAQTDFLKSVLTEDQFKKYEEDQRRMMEQFGGGGFGGF